MARFSRLDNQAPSQSELDASPINVGRSVHDFSFIHSGNALFGALFPVDCFDVVPNETVNINLNSLFEFRNPTTRQLLNGMRVYFHAYYNRLTDLWEGARNFLDTGRSGNISLNRPKLIYAVNANSSDQKVNACTPLSLLNYLGLPAEAATGVTNAYTDSDGVLHEKGIINPLYQFSPAGYKTYYDADGHIGNVGMIELAKTPDYFPADCAFAYQKNWRDFYSNKNLLQNNKYWFPDNEDHFILSYSCENAVCLNYENEYSSDDDDNFANIAGFLVDEHREFGNTFEPNNPATSGVFDPSDFVSMPNLSGIKFRQFRGDRFTTSLPFPDLVRGSIPALQPEQNTTIDFLDALSPSLEDSSTLIGLSSESSKPGLIAGPTSSSLDTGVTSVDTTASAKAAIRNALNKAKLKNIGSISLNDIRALETFTVFKERMARTNGDYNDMIESQFGFNPKVHDRKASYIGGFYQDFALSAVTQTSESSSNSPLGSKAGVGLSSGSGNIGSFSVPDFGWIQIYASIVYTPMYTQGISRMFSKKIQTDMYFPIFNNLAPQAILNKELFVSGVTSTDNDVFAYEDRYAEYKSRTNRVSGFMGLSHSVAAYDAARVMSRRFTTTPALNSNFVSMIPENVDMEVFSVVDEPPIDYSIGVSVRRSFPGPYTAIPGALSSSLHA